jgi:hypothetical protein
MIGRNSKFAVWLSMLGLTMMPMGESPLPIRPFNHVKAAPAAVPEETEAQRRAREKRERKNKRRLG